MISLFLDTSSSYLNIGIFKNGTLLSSLYKKFDRDLSKEALFEIKNLLDSSSISVHDLDEIICVKGPGSFTGLRVGVTIAKTMSYFLGIKLYSTSSLDVMATSCNSQIIVPLIDARRGYVYASIYDKNYNVLMDECYIKLDALIKKVDSYSLDYIYISNDSFSFNSTLFKPSLENFYKYGKKTLEDPMLFVPNYLKRPEAEEKLCDNKC